MKHSRPTLLLPLLALLAACAGYQVGDLKPGVSRLEDVERALGPATMRWQAGDGSQQLAYARGPLGFHTYMAYVAPDGRLQRLENVLATGGFARVRPGMSKDEVLRTLGPSDPYGTTYFAARDELVWDWRYCNDWNAPARFYVLFDGRSETVRSTLSLTESQIGYSLDLRPRFCGR